MGMCIALTVVMVSRVNTYTQTHQFIQVDMCSVCVYQLHLNKAVAKLSETNLHS